MKAITITIAILFQTILLFGQKVTSKTLVQISKSEFSKHQPIDKNIFQPSSIKKTKGALRFVTAKKSLVLKDDGEFVQYHCIGDIAGTLLTLVQEEDPNSEEYYFINRQTAIVDTLVGEPIFAVNKQDIVCLQGVETDVKQKIQVGQIKNGQFITKAYIQLKQDLSPDYIYWFDSNTLFLKEGQNYWKLTIKN